MTRVSIWTIAAIVAIVQVAGCKSADDEFAPAVVPKTYVFEGKVEPRFAGTWLSVDGSSTMEIVKDGNLQIKTTTRSVAGKNTTYISGNWLCSGDTLMFRYSIGNQAPAVLKYTASITGNNLTLKQAEGRTKTTYRRK